MKVPRLFKEIVFLAAVICIVVSCAVNPVTGKRQLMLMSEAREVQMGAEYDPQVIATFGEYKDEQTLSLLQSKADAMGLISHRPKLKYHVKILDSPVVNAFAVPGGYIYFTRGILAQFNNEAELIGVLGHEMGHITARHSASQQSRQTLGTLILLGGMIASEEFAPYAQYALQGMQLLFLKFSRDNEREADKLGVAYSSQIGYDASQMAEFFNVLKKMSMPDEQGGVPTFLSTHPDPVDRYEAVRQDAMRWQDSLKLDSYRINADSYLHMIDGMVYGEDPRQGFVEGNTFYHPQMKFKFSYPAGWKFENLPSQVNMAPADGKALMVFTFAEGSSLDEAAGASLQKLDLKPRESFRTTINNMPAVMALSEQTYQDQATGQQQANMIISCFIDYNSDYYVFHGVTAEADYNAYKELFMTGMGSFSVLSEPSKLNRKPVRILVRRVQQSGTLAEAFRYYGVQQDKMQELALLNNLELTDRVQSGKLIKITGY
jgi:predicted Zn-dependent protease